MNLTENPVRQAADNRARVLGYAGIVDMLETAYGNDKPWTEVAQELGVAHVDTVAQWARKLGLKRGNAWYRGHLAPIGRAASDPPRQRRQNHHDLLSDAVQRAARRVRNAAAYRSLVRCGRATATEDDPLLMLTPDEEAEWLGYRNQESRNYANN